MKNFYSIILTLYKTSRLPAGKLNNGSLILNGGKKEIKKKLPFSLLCACFKNNAQVVTILFDQLKLLLASGKCFLIFFCSMSFIEVSYFIKIFHTILGFFATVFFILYSIEHLKKYKASFLKKKSQKKVAYSGLIYLLLVGLVLISGVVLFFYDADYVVVWNPIHFYSSFFILITLFLHWITRK